jgi:DNA-damage-inducible protein J
MESEVTTMPDTITIRTHLEPDLKSAADEVLARLGLTAGEAVHLFYRELVTQDGLPFGARTPNATTRETFEKTDRGEDVVLCRDADDLFHKLEI